MKISERDLIRSLCRDSYTDFVQRFWHTITKETLRWNWHMDVVCEELQRQAKRVWRGERRDHDTVFNVPPGTSKSSLCSILFIPWVWTFFPNAQFICVSYAEDLAQDLSTKSRDVLRSELYQACWPEVKIRRDQDTKTNFKNLQGGYRYCAGSGGQVMGFHGHFIIIDDPLNPKEALSEVQLKSVNHWIKHELRGRKVRKSVTWTGLIMQRLHQDDPSAQAIKRPRVLNIRLPATTEYTVNPPELKDNYTAIPEYPHRLLDPVGLDIETLLEEKSPAGLGEYGYAGQYGQDPVPSEGGMFKTHLLRWGDVPDKTQFRYIVRYWDKAATQGGGAYTVGVKMGVDRQNRIWILNVVRRQVDSFTRERLIKRTAFLDGRGVIVGVEEEGGSGGKESAEGTSRRLMGYRVRRVSPRGDKTVRADEFSVQVNGGNVWLPATFRNGDDWSGWAAEYVEELKHFPFSTYKDQVDGSSGGLTCLVRGRRRVGGVRKTRKVETLRAI